MAQQLAVSEIPAAILLNNYTGDFDVRTGRWLPGVRQAKAKSSTASGNYVRLSESGGQRLNRVVITGMGAIYHTLNPRLFPDQIAWIINHAEDTHVFYDITFQPIVEAIKDKVPSVKHWIVLTDAAHKPQSAMNIRTYEEYIAPHSTDVVWGDFPEDTACGLCYTSGTTGDPKGVLYSHRSNVLHTLIGMQADAIGIGAKDTVLPVVPMFHANAWGIAFSAPAVGSKLVLPGAKMDGESIYQLLNDEQVTFTAAVPPT